MKFTLHTSSKNGGPFQCQPAGQWELNGEQILANDVHFPWEHRMRGGPKLYVIGHEFGATCAVWADCEQDALDEVVDNDLFPALLVEEPEKLTDAEREDFTPLGNAGELCDLTNVWLATVDFDPKRDIELIVALAEARGACNDNLNN